MEIAKLVATRSTCLRRQVGAVLVKDKRILATGYDGAPSGVTHCEEVGCLRDELKIPSGERHELCRALHAEQNAIIQAAKMGVNVAEATLYLTNQPCFICSKMIINAGVKEVIYGEGYPDSFARDILKEAGVKITKLEPQKTPAFGKPTARQAETTEGTESTE